MCVCLSAADCLVSSCFSQNKTNTNAKKCNLNTHVIDNKNKSPAVKKKGEEKLEGG